MINRGFHRIGVVFAFLAACFVGLMFYHERPVTNDSWFRAITISVALIGGAYGFWWAIGWIVAGFFSKPPRDD